MNQLQTWPIGLHVGFTRNLVSGDVRHPFSFQTYKALGSTHRPEFFPTGFYFWFTWPASIWFRKLHMETSILHVH